MAHFSHHINYTATAKNGERPSRSCKNYVTIRWHGVGAMALYISEYICRNNDTIGASQTETKRKTGSLSTVIFVVAFYIFGVFCLRLFSVSQICVLFFSCIFFMFHDNVNYDGHYSSRLLGVNGRMAV